MNNFLFYSHFSGGGGSAMGAKESGFTVLGGIEFDERIAELYRANIGDVLVEDITQVKPQMLDIPFPKERQKNNQVLLIQTSPPCQEFSRSNKKPNLESSRATIIKETYSHYLVFKPEYVLLENVPEYKKHKAYKDFEDFLIFQNYRILKFVVNAADFGVPQSRQRLIMIAVKEGYPIPQIEATHHKTGQLSLFEKPKLPWLGWYEAIADLIETLPSSSLTQKQQQTIASKVSSIRSPLLVNGRNSRLNGYPAYEAEKPIWTITATDSRGMAKALLVERIGYYKNPKIANSTIPCWTLRACLSDDGKNRGGRNKIIDAVLENADVRSLNVAALARLQSFPDNYRWSGVIRTDVRVIGNSVPPLLMKKICEAITSSLK